MMRIIVMGVSGSGKTSVGMAIAESLKLPFLEGDTLHPQGNIDKMASGIPLTDDDRWPWLDAIGTELAKAQSGLVVSCSALKINYRDRLRDKAGGPLAFIFLDGSIEVLRGHMSQRTGHFMPLSMLDSQIATLEVPNDEALVYRQDVVNSVDDIVKASVNWLREELS
ncbi:gluconokinase [Phyllobacterium sp. YR531]|uniref:gluconokinase n=1 Tax=Phyllobacterium sp. YR531 TaxID=1144343 RepID=UPI00026F98F1|nr:gluconokinase [Phyllobacterium sp. YR531]EJN01224.1 carbohydrate kinase, thermoresistant glucokinase family [Phyllobacterium sp. YR531]